MKEEFKTYLQAVGFEEPSIERVSVLLERLSKLYPEEIESIFVSEYLVEAGTRQPEALWVFSQRFVSELQNFLIEDSFDMVPLTKEIVRWATIPHAYDFETATPESRLNVFVDWGWELVNGELKASGENCDFLRDIVLKHVVPNLHTGPGE